MYQLARERVEKFHTVASDKRNRSLDLRTFRIALARQLIDKYFSRKKKPLPSSIQVKKSVVPDHERLASVGNHMPEIVSNYRRSTGTTVSRQIVYRRLRHIGLYARRPVRRVPFTATHCRLRLTWSREHALWTPQQWSCVMFSDESRFSLLSDSRRTLIWRAPGTRYHQENTIE
ncbi:transposable element Tcb1 transposase [Trichonephila clavipes]|uniref:Transposable element Tcb1 transposase n=1 Tax=Trichonephila clavipes TaxID=2585209 RepID=A0A8X6SPV9_TRICX|nr:transposable element Tcb1 transposase [Trichonephila clavipes]